MERAVESDTSSGTPTSSSFWKYDPVGNRTLAQVDGSSRESAYNELNQLTGSEGGPTVFSGSLDEPSSVTVGGQSARLLPGGIFEAELGLAPGTHDITIEATDGSSNTASETYRVTVPTHAAETYVYDLDGNLTSDGEKTYEWDRLNRLTTINYTGTDLRTEFEYDGFGRRTRIKELDNGTPTTNNIYLWSGSEIVQKRSSDGSTVLRQYFTEGFLEGTDKYFYTRDLLGSIREVVANGGTTVESQYEYSPWGEITRVAGETNGTESDFLYTGHYQHQASGLALTYFRAYHADLGRWLSRDPIESVTGEMPEMLPEGPNLYAYVGNNPVNHLDPLGLKNCNEDAYEKCKEKYKKDNYGMVGEISDAIGWYGLGAAAVGAAGELAGRGADAIGNAAQWELTRSGASNASTAASNAASITAGRIFWSRLALRAVSSATAVAGAAATGFSMGMDLMAATACSHLK